MFSILHISDLHRSAEDPISNPELVSALISDCDRYTQEEPRVRAPDAIVVSGDIIQGVGLGVPDHAVQLAEQYQVAEEFLVELSRRLLGGNRSKVIIVPGNHDVDWNTAFNSMELVETGCAPGNLRSVLLTEKAQYRWDWRSRDLYRISDPAAYATRLNAFWQFFDRFYAGTPGLLNVKPGADVNFFSLCDGAIGVAAFNSCHGNDCFAVHGYILPEVIARAHLELTSPPNIFDLLLAVWHHSMEGPPYRTDYMNIDLVRQMIGRGFRAGLYGHQHTAQASPYEISLPGREIMAAISAGSLCAGPHDLPVGIPRQYNIVEISDDFHNARVHVRQMATANLFGRASLPAFGGLNYTNIKWAPPANTVRNPSEQRMRGVVAEAEAALKQGDAAKCRDLLQSQAPRLDDYGRRLLIDAAARTQDWNLLVDLLAPPRNAGELVSLVNAHIVRRAFGRARHALDEYSAATSIDRATENALRQRLSAEEKIHG